LFLGAFLLNSVWLIGTDYVMNWW